MMYALNDQEEKISASIAEKDKSYLCPNLRCKNRELILRKGKIRIPHFAHKIRTDCELESESEIHLACKLYFQNLLDLDNEFVEYYGIEGVRPDVLYKKNAIEIQCSSITAEEISRRNKIYKSHGLMPIWIFLEESFFSKTENPPNLEAKKIVEKGCFEEIRPRRYKGFSFTRDNKDFQIKFNDYHRYFGGLEIIKSQKIKTKYEFDKIVGRIPEMIRIASEFSDIRERYYELPEETRKELGIQISLKELFLEKNCSIEEFRKWLENEIIDCYLKDIRIRDWAAENAILRNEIIYKPLCKNEKIKLERRALYKIFFDIWIAKEYTYQDGRYLYLENWYHEKIQKKIEEEKEKRKSMYY